MLSRVELRFPDAFSLELIDLLLKMWVIDPSHHDHDGWDQPARVRGSTQVGRDRDRHAGGGVRAIFTELRRDLVELRANVILNKASDRHQLELLHKQILVLCYDPIKERWTKQAKMQSKQRTNQKKIETEGTVLSLELPGKLQ